MHGNRDTTLIDRESAEKALKALTTTNDAERIAPAALASALARTLTRKLANEPHTAKCDDLPGKFENFFDILFDVAYERKGLPTETVIELAENAVAVLRENEQEARVSTDPDDADMAEMYHDDAKDYETVITLLKSGDTKAAIKHYSYMDTAARGRLFGRTDQERYELGVFLHENGY